MKPISLLIISVVLLAPLASGQAKVSPKTAAATAGDFFLLPPFFSGWQRSANTQAGNDPAKIDPKNADLLKELGVLTAETATYTREGRKLTIQAYRFADTTGAYGAFTIYKDAQMAAEKICDHSASRENHVIFSCTNLLIFADYDKATAMSLSELRSLASQLPKVSGSAALAPNLPLYLPREASKNVQFALGPIGLARLGAPLSAELIDFSKGAEVVVSKMAKLDGPATLTLVKYPTFKIAAERQNAFNEFAWSRKAPASKSDVPDLNTFYTKRIGPLVAVVAGEIPEREAKNLVEKITYDAEITQNEAGYTQKDNMANLVVNIIYLAFIIIGFTLVGGVAFGGYRILSRRYFPNHFLGRPNDAEFIKLDLKD